MDKLERSILNQSYDHFVKSSDYNGLAIYNLFCKEDWNCIEKAIIQLITNGVLEITDQSCSYNPMIIHHPFLDIEGQISIIKNGNNNTSIVLYPSASYLKAHRDVSDLSDKPFERMLALGIPQFKSIFFSWDVLHMYASDPRYTFIFNDYHGEISSSPDLGKEQFIHLRTFGVGRCNDNFVVVAFPKDLREMSPINQGIWYAKMIDEQSACKGLRQYYDNVFGGC